MHNWIQIWNEEKVNYSIVNFYNLFLILILFPLWKQIKDDIMLRDLKRS